MFRATSGLTPLAVDNCASLRSSDMFRATSGLTPLADNNWASLRRSDMFIATHESPVCAPEERDVLPTNV